MAKNTRPRDRAPQKSQVERAQVSEFHGFASLSFVPLCVTTFGADTCADAPSIALAVACAVGDFLPPSFPTLTGLLGGGSIPSCFNTRRPSAVFFISLTRLSLSRFAISFSIRDMNAFVCSCGAAFS